MHENPRQSHIKINLNEAAIVKFIFEQYALGYGLKAITNKLNSKGTRTKKGCSFGIAAVRGILKNVNYIGKIRFGVNEVTLGLHQALIEQPLWDEVHNIIVSRSLTPKRLIKRSHPLTGFLKCPQCGHGMIPSHSNFVRKNGSSKTYYYYACENHSNKGSSVCKPNIIPADAIEHWFQRQLEKLLLNPNMLDQLFTAVNKKSNLDYKPQLEELNRLDAELISFEEQQKKFFRQYEEGLLNKETLIFKLKEIKSLRESTVLLIETFQQNIDIKKVVVVPLHLIREAISQLWTVMSTVSEQQQRQLLKLMIDKITISMNRDVEKAVIHTTSALMHMQLSS
jgi:site-specific DNA recombinase